MKVCYIGPAADGVEVVHPDPAAPDATTVTVCRPGEPVDLPDPLAASLVAAGSFEPAAMRRRGRSAGTEEGEG